MSLAFYSVYFKAQNKVSEESESTYSTVAEVISVRHGFSYKFAIPYLGAFLAFQKRQFLVGSFLFIYALAMAAVSRFLVTKMPLANEFFLIGSFYLLGSYGPSLVESSISSSGKFKLAGVYLAENEDDAIRKFYKASTKKAY